MLTEKVQDSLNNQFNTELYSSYLYLSMHAYFKSINLDGFANWMNQQAKEELVHAMKVYDFINQRGGRARTAAVAEPPSDWESPLAVFEETLDHEQKVTGLINDLIEIANEAHDHATQIFLQWFVTEQVEEEERVSGTLEQLKHMQGHAGGLFMIDRELAKRLGPTRFDQKE